MVCAAKERTTHSFMVCAAKERPLGEKQKQVKTP
jgi:hypothetical protein